MSSFDAQVAVGGEALASPWRFVPASATTASNPPSLLAIWCYTVAIGRVYYIMPSFVPSGFPIVLRYLGTISVPVFSVLLLTYVVAIPTWAFILLEVISLPIFFAARIHLKNLRERRAAAQLGAALPSRFDGSQLGNYDLLLRLQNAYKRGYLGQ